MPTSWPDVAGRKPRQYFGPAVYWQGRTKQNQTSPWSISAPTRIDGSCVGPMCKKIYGDKIFPEGVYAFLRPGATVLRSQYALEAEL
jgi:hypothetical protein